MCRSTYLPPPPPYQQLKLCPTALVLCLSETPVFSCFRGSCTRQYIIVFHKSNRAVVMQISAIFVPTSHKNVSFYSKNKCKLFKRLFMIIITIVIPSTCRAYTTTNNSKCPCFVNIFESFVDI